MSETALQQGGCTAGLLPSHWISLIDLLYGTLLPSGNDAAYLLAQIFGLLLCYEELKSPQRQYTDIQSIDLQCYDTTQPFVRRFIREMNQRARKLKMEHTVYHNPHGLPNPLNLSTARDLLRLSRYAWTLPLFREVVGTKNYCAQTHLSQTHPSHSSQKEAVLLEWTNTNRLLGEGWEGVKTGSTQPAGGCLVSRREGVFIVVLGCRGNDTRFTESIQLYNWFTEPNEFVIRHSSHHPQREERRTNKINEDS